MHEFLSEQAAELARLAAMIRSGLEQAETMIPSLNDQLNELSMLRVTSHQVEGPSIYARPAGLSNDTDDSVIVFQPVLLMPGGIGAAAWNGDDFNEYRHCSYGEQTDLRDRFLPYGKLRPIANRLTAKGIPTPGAGTKRKRNGVEVPVSTAWHSEAVMQLLQNPVIIGLQAYGRHSAGTHERWSPDGPRDIDDRDVSVDAEGQGGTHQGDGRPLGQR